MLILTHNLRNTRINTGDGIFFLMLIVSKLYLPKTRWNIFKANAVLILLGLWKFNDEEKTHFSLTIFTPAASVDLFDYHFHNWSHEFHSDCLSDIITWNGFGELVKPRRGSVSGLSYPWGKDMEYFWKKQVTVKNNTLFASNSATQDLRPVSKNFNFIIN